MAAGTSPTGALIAQKLMERLASRGAPGQGAAGMTQPGVGGDQLQESFQGLSGADPEAATKTIKAMIQGLSRIYVQLVMQVPDAAQKVADAQKALSKALEPIQKASATLNAVRPQIANTAGLPPGFNGPGGGGDEGAM